MRDRSILYSSIEETLARGPKSRGRSIFVGGFPCQDLSIAGLKKGLHADRSGLWLDYFEVIAAELPCWIVTENVGHTWKRWVPELRRDLYGLGYSSLPLRVRASDLGAPHERCRIYLVAHANGQFLRELSRWWVGKGRKMADEFAFNGKDEQVADSDRERLEIWESIDEDSSAKFKTPIGAGWWSVEPPVGRVVDGFPGRVDQLTALGNAIIPQIAEIIAAGIRSVDA